MVYRWALAGAAALMLGGGFGILSGNVLLAVAAAALVILVAAFLPYERRPSDGPAQRSGRSRRKAGSEAGYVAPWGGTADGDTNSPGDCGPGGDGGGSFGGDGGGAGGC